ncbi:hypothetical protein RHE_CH02008 [Rhizobium etli CFN 42]|uniref:Restriction endonuclease n=1 Tax=Rhizobium etli (strain ATCC 51251 / DSM 11541 / JCM 21823 / NBRC 15573 / CFN 42) TaxID=347834 RepID=Q2K8P3_RHIEC|nr:hypothetical protein [Rhizobium etli]ABC90793.1 hypothetical protein RHE_CH02008 [Rhizobium etli CFN 42]
MDFIDKQIAPPKSWEKFEELTRALFGKIWLDPVAQKNGRTGQKQHGVDVYGSPPDRPGAFRGVQCKGKEGNYGAKATIDEFDAELAKAEKFEPGLTHWTFATTAPNDATLQRHARIVSEQRVREGRFPVVAVGWETIQAIMSGHSDIIEQFYPEHSGDLPAVLAALKALPKPDELEAIKIALRSVAKHEVTAVLGSNWSEVRFETARNLGPALMGRPLGPADVAACPLLPEVAELLADLERAWSARLSGVAGAGKSICMLQAARHLHAKGWRVLRLDDPMAESIPAIEASTPTLLIVDDAHLARPAFVRRLEEQATATCRVLSGHTIGEGRENTPGTIQLDAKRAVRVIADGLRAVPDVTLEAVRRADDHVGHRPGDERLEQRLDHAAEVALFPWQFCFILGGGWRRASALASSARAAGFDLVLAAVAIRQLGTRDARCSETALVNFIGDTVSASELGPAIEWLVTQRLLLARDDLRCPHQRLASVLLTKVLEGQSALGRKAIGTMLHRLLINPEVPVGGIALLLNELSFGGDYGRWHKLVEREWLNPLLERCWAASAPNEIREACWALNALHGYAVDEMAIVAAHEDELATWITSAPQGACYAIGQLINHIHNEDGALGRTISAKVEPLILARAISTAEPLHACEIAKLISAMRVAENEDWKAVYLKRIDRFKLFGLVSRWPEDAWLSAVADLCKHFCYFEPEFGYQLIEALIPAVAKRLRGDPQYSFRELDDIVWHSLRLYDPLEVYVGKLAPTRRMRQVGRKICACWSPVDLAAKLSQSTPRNFQSAAGLLSFIRKAAPKMFEATVLALDWNEIDQQIGAGWAEEIGDARMLLGVAWGLPAARPAIEALVARNEAKITTMSAHLAAVAPESAFRHIANGRSIALSYSGHVEWRLGGAVLIRFIEKKRQLIPALIAPHLGAIATALSQQSPTFYNEALLFLQLMIAVDSNFLQKVLRQVEVDKATRGWRDALAGRQNNHVRGAKSEAMQVVALLIQHAIERKDPVGDLARQLRKDFPKSSVPLAATIEPIDLPEG